MRLGKHSSKIQVAGGTEREKRLFYSTFFHAFKWPALRSDVNHEYTDVRGEVVNNGFHYYTDPSFWDDYRNKLVLIGMISPDVTTDIIRSIIDKGEKRDGYMPTFFHGDHASTFISGSWLRGLHDFDLERAYKLILKMLRCPVKEDVAIWMSIWSEVGLLKRHSECTHMGRIQRGCDQDPGICLR